MVIFSEMCFSGYLFKDFDAIEPFLEVAGKGPTFEFISSLAKKLKSYVLCGYPEKDKDKYYNSV